MKTKMNKVFVLFLVSIFALTGACDLLEQEERTYQGDPKLEFYPLTRTVGLTPAQSGQVTTSVQLIGERKSDPFSFDVIVVDTLTTAVSGDHYTLPSTTAAIPADSNSVDFPINVTGANLTQGQEVVLTLRLQTPAGSDVQPAENLKDYTLTIQGN